MKKRNLGILALMIGLMIYLGYLIYLPRIERRMRFFLPKLDVFNYHDVIYYALAIGFILLVFSKFEFGKKIFTKNSKFVRYASYIVFLPLALFPIVRCYFKIPYIFCKACPEPCPWGTLAKFTIPSFLVLNVDRRLFCFNLCPFGTIQDMQCSCSTSRIKLPKWLRLTRYISLLFTLFVLVRLFFGNFIPEGMIFKNNYDPTIWSLIIFGLIFMMSFYVPRFWCNYFCPIGTVGDLTLKLKKKIVK